MDMSNWEGLLFQPLAAPSLHCPPMPSDAGYTVGPKARRFLNLTGFRRDSPILASGLPGDDSSLLKNQQSIITNLCIPWSNRVPRGYLSNQGTLTTKKKWNANGKQSPGRKQVLSSGCWGDSWHSDWACLLTAAHRLPKQGVLEETGKKLQAPGPQNGCADRPWVKQWASVCSKLRG